MSEFAIDILRCWLKDQPQRTRAAWKSPPDGGHGQKSWAVRVVPHACITHANFDTYAKPDSSCHRNGVVIGT
ncbi:MAG: hypothetical protein MK538_05100 [Planctomycetes bacterium]|nr:hypothetical protein [Planctomycetota bacterium]